MEQIGFIGANDKKDLLLNIAKILTTLRYNVLIVDATLNQRLRYVAPVIGNGQNKTYISEYQGIDIALGFMNLNGVAGYLRQSLSYDYILIDTDNVQTMSSYGIPRLEKNFFVTSYDEYELQKGMEMFKFIQTPMEMYKIIVSSNATRKEDEYLDYLIGQTNSKWKGEKVIFLDSDHDRRATLENQLTKQIRLKRYTTGYKSCLEYVVALILGNLERQKEIKNVMKKM